MTQILYAEDEVLGKLVKEALEHEPGFKVNWVRNGAEALSQFKAQVPDICILDVMMPVMDGFTLAKQINVINPDVPVIFLTSRLQTEDVIKGFELGGNDYLKKPFDIGELVVRVKELLRRACKSSKRFDTLQVPSTRLAKRDIVFFFTSHATLSIQSMAFPVIASGLSLELEFKNA